MPNISLAAARWTSSSCRRSICRATASSVGRLPDGDQPLSFQDLSRLLPQVGINWVKVPVWFDANDPRRGDELIRFVEMLGASNIDVVGIIDRPPTKPGDHARMPREISIAEVLSQDAATWAAALEPVMSRLALRVRWWQLGRDYDTSLISLPDLNKRITDLRTALFRFGQDVRMGMCADWDGSDAYTGNVLLGFSAGWPANAADREKIQRAVVDAAAKLGAALDYCRSAVAGQLSAAAHRVGCGRLYASRLDANGLGIFVSCLASIGPRDAAKE